MRQMRSTCSGRGEALLDQPEALEAERAVAAVHEEAHDVGGDDGMAAHRLAGRAGDGERRLAGALPGDDLDQLHDRRRVEEVHADHALGAGHAGGDLGDAQRGGVAGQHAVAGHVLGDLGEQLALELEVLGRGLDDQARVRERRDVVGRLERAELRRVRRGPSPPSARAAPGRRRPRAPAPPRPGRAAACARPAWTASCAIPAPIVPAPEYPDRLRSSRPRVRVLPAVDPFTVIFGGTLAFFVVFVLLLGMFSKRSALDILDWKPTRSPRGRGPERHRRHRADDRRAERAAAQARACPTATRRRSRRACGATARSSPSSAGGIRSRAGSKMARVLIVPCGCRGRALAADLVSAGHAVRGTTRSQANA